MALLYTLPLSNELDRDLGFLLIQSSTSINLYYNDCSIRVVECSIRYYLTFSDRINSVK